MSKKIPRPKSLQTSSFLIVMKQHTLTRYRRFAILFFLGIIFYLGGAGLFNYLIDPYGVFFHKTHFHQEPNQSYIKTRHILQHPEKYDGLIFGSSRVGRFDPTVIQEGKFYNMTYSQGLPANHLAILQLLSTRDIFPKKIIIGLEEFSYRLDPKVHLQEPSRKPHHLVTQESKLRFLQFYLTMTPTQRRIKNALSGSALFFGYDFSTTGMPIIPKAVDKAIDNDPQNHNAKPVFLQTPSYQGMRLEETLYEISSLVQLAKHHNAEIVFFIHPLHLWAYLGMDHQVFDTFLLRLSAISNFYDFSGIHTISTNNLNYYENIHYRKHVADAILHTILHHDIRHDFGTYVTAKNIEQHLRNKRAAREDFAKQ